jgi:rubrerythrin
VQQIARSTPLPYQCASVPGVRAAPSTFDRLLRPLHRWVWSDARRRGRKLLRFSATEADGGRDISRAAELTRDAPLRRLYLRHAEDELRHADFFARRAREILTAHRGAGGFEANWLAPGERGLDDLRVDRETDESLLAFLHLSEKAAAGRFALYAEVLDLDPETRALFARILEDEAFHMSYTRKQLARLAPRKQGLRLWQARAARIWSVYLRFAVGLAALLGGLLLTLQYFVVLPIFALLARRAERREPEGFVPARSAPPLRSQY